MLPEKEWFTIDEVAERWGVQKDLVEHYLLTGKLTASLYVPLIFHKIGVIEGIKDIRDYRDFTYALMASNSASISFCHEKFGVILKLDEINACIPNKISKSDVIVTYTNLKTFEDKYDVSIKSGSNIATLAGHSISNIPPYLDPGHEHYSEELAAAIMSWEYASSKNPPKCDFKRYAEERLNKMPGLYDGAKERIAIVANPHKNTGRRSKK
ncbi:MAG: hypothetical protein AB7T17_04005 [Geobacter sp.]